MYEIHEAGLAVLLPGLHGTRTSLSYCPRFSGIYLQEQQNNRILLYLCLGGKSAAGAEAGSPPRRGGRGRCARRPAGRPPAPRGRRRPPRCGDPTAVARRVALRVLLLSSRCRKCAPAAATARGTGSRTSHPLSLQARPTAVALPSAPCTPTLSRRSLPLLQPRQRRLFQRHTQRPPPSSSSFSKQQWPPSRQRCLAGCLRAGCWSRCISSVSVPTTASRATTRMGCLVLMSRQWRSQDE
jgi:hypothetical protein